MSNKRKLLYIVEAMGGGVFTYIVNMANVLVDTYDMYIAYAVREQTPTDYHLYFDSRINLIKVNNFCREIGIRKEVKAIVEITRIADEIKPDIIHLHSSKAGVLGRIAFCRSKIPVFYTPHGYSFLMKEYDINKRFVFKLIEFIMAKTKCVTISCSPGEHRETLKLTKRAYYVNNGINKDEIDKYLMSTSVTNQEYSVFTLGRICFQKNPKLFNEIAQRLPHIKFLWIGDGEMRDVLTSPNITISGWISREEALILSKKADTFLLTSLWEGMPISLLEAMYMKKLCVVSNVIGNNDVIIDGINGYVCNNIEQYVDAILSKRNNILIQQAYADVVTKYETSVQVNSYINIYTKYAKDN